MDEYQILANNIVLQAVTDYRDALQGRIINKRNPEDTIKECERFFLSDWYRMLTRIDGKTLLKRIKEQHFNESKIDSGNP